MKTEDCNTMKKSFLGMIVGISILLAGVCAYADSVVMDKYKIEKQIEEVTCSSYQNSGCVPERGIDDDMTTMWNARGEGEWLKAELKEKKTVGALGISFDQGNKYQYSFSAAVSADGSTWKTIYEGLSYLSTICYYDFEPTEVKFIKITMNGSTLNLNNGIRNINLYSQGTEHCTVLNFAFDDVTALYDYAPENPPSPRCKFTVVGEMLKSYAKGRAEVKVKYKGQEEISSKTYDFSVAPGRAEDIYCMLDPVKEPGWYTAEIDLYINNELVSVNPYGFGIIRKAAEGLKPDSPFGLNFRSEGDLETEILIGEKIGVKWTRSVPHADPSYVKPTEDGPYWDEEGNDEGRANIEKAWEEINNYKKHGISVLGAVNYNMPWNVTPLADGSIPALHQNMPKNKEAQAEMVYHLIKPFYGTVNNWEIWNEPWVHGWTWRTGDTQDYRDMSKLIYQKVKAEMPDVSLIAGGSTAYQRDSLYAQGSKDTGYNDGSVNHAYSTPSMGLISALKEQMNMDKLYSRGKGKGGMWQTEGGILPSEFKGTQMEQQLMVSRVVTTAYLQNLFVANNEIPMKYFWFALSYGKGFSGGDHNMYDEMSRTPYPCVVAYSAMTHFLEDTKYKCEAFPYAKSTWGYVFERDADHKATAAVYSATDYNGSMVIHDAYGIKAYDYLGKEISSGNDETLVIPINYWETVFLVSDLTAEELKNKLASAEMRYDNMLVIHPQNFVKPLDNTASIDIKVENVTNKTVSGEMKIKAPEGWSLKSDTVKFENLEMAQSRILSVQAEQIKENDMNRYLIGYELKLDGSDSVQKGEQTIQLAYAPKKSIKVDGDFSDWDSIIGVTMINNGVIDTTSAALDPSKAKEILSNDPSKADKVMYTLKTAWDDKNFYVYAQIPDAEQTKKAPFKENPYLFPWNFDCLQLGFKPLETNPDDLFKDDEYYYKGLKAGIDYEFDLTATTDGGTEIYRVVAPGTHFQNYYPTNAPLEVPVGAMDASEKGGKDGQLVIKRDDENMLTTYECAISLDNISALKDILKTVGRGETAVSRFAFGVGDSGSGSKGSSFWQREMNCVEKLAERGLAPNWSNQSGNINTRWGFGNY